MQIQKQERMYGKTKTWNPGVGCLHGCKYCIESFQRTLQRQPCEKCKSFVPHLHPERLDRIPAGYDNIFVFGNGDIAFYPFEFVIKTIETIIDYRNRHPNNAKKTFYFQSKDPILFARYIDALTCLGGKAVLLTTLETNRNKGYKDICPHAPLPQERFEDFVDLVWDRKIVTIEPVMDFDLHDFTMMIDAIGPEMIYMGYNSRPKAIRLPEPPIKKFREFYRYLKGQGYKIKLKNKDRLTPS
jgi:hypothetical protein